MGSMAQPMRLFSPEKPARQRIVAEGYACTDRLPGTETYTHANITKLLYSAPVYTVFSA